MTVNASAPWHRASFDRFIHDWLPQLLAERLPLAAYEVEATGPYTCRVRVALAPQEGDVEVAYDDLPQPSEGGVFEIGGEQFVVVPLASSERLDVAEIRCVGEQLYEYVEARLGESPPELPWDASLLRAWLPLERWVREFLASAQPLDQTNWLSRHTHLRRLVIPARQEAVTAGQSGRTCPFETPEGPNIGRVLSVALGAEIRDGRLVIVDGRPEAALGLTASMIPFLEHNDASHLLFAANMMRQWPIPPDPEPALVQAGNEPGAPGFWCGRNLLTAFVSLGSDTFEEGIVISESCARRLGYPQPVEPGDKLSNRHGTKGVVSRIVPDGEMPHLADGTAVELVYSFIALHSRLTFGAVREAVMGRIARAEGAPAIVAPFHAPGERELIERLARAGLPGQGMERLTLGGQGLRWPSTVGWVYWGRTFHLAGEKLGAAVRGPDGMRQGELEYYALRDAGAIENIRETYNTRSVLRADADTLATRVAAGGVGQAGPPAPLFSELQRRLVAAGIRAELDGDRLAFRLAPPAGPTLRLARAVRHPWLCEHTLAQVGVLDGVPEYAALAEANARLERMLAGHAPESLVARATARLEREVQAFFDALLTPDHLRFDGQVLFSGKAVLAPGGGLRLDQVGLPEEMAWTLFGPLLLRETKDEAALRARTEWAAQALDGLMALSWVIVNRAPTLVPRAFLAFHPVRVPDRVIRLHPLACMLLDADFDGDQAAILLPITAEGQREAGERLSVGGHVASDPALLQARHAAGHAARHPLLALECHHPLLPMHEAMWGLALLSLSADGREELAALIGAGACPPAGLLTRASLAEAIAHLAQRDGIARAFSVLEALMVRGFAVARGSGASLSPFAGATLERPPEPESDDPAAWEAYAEQAAEQLASRADYGDADLGPQLLAVKSGARGQLRHLARLVGPQGVVADAAGRPVVVRHGFAQGLTAAEMYATAARARLALAQLHPEMEQLGLEVVERSRPRGFNVLARAMRAQRPGIVFARAAASGEVDPLADIDSRLFVGLPA